MNSIKPSTSFQMRNEQLRLSLLANQEDIPFADGSSSPTSGSQENLAGSKPTYVLSSPWKTVTPPPSSIPPLVSPLYNSVSSVFSFLVSIILVILFFVGFPLCLAIFVIGAVFRFGVKLILSGSIPTPLPISRVFGSTDDDQLNTVLLIISGHCDIQKIRRCFMNVLNTGKYYKLRKRLTKEMGYLCLDNCRVRFDIKNHVKIFENRKGGNLILPTTTEADIILYLEKHHGQPLFQGEGQIPQWEVLVVPKYVQNNNKQGGNSNNNDNGESYALIFRFHNGIMDWPMLRELVTEHLGRTAGQVRTPFEANQFGSVGLQLKMFFDMFFSGPAAFMRKLLRMGGSSSNKFLPLKKVAIGDLSMGLSREIPCTNWEEIQERTRTGNHCALACCITTSARNLFLSQNLNVPKCLQVNRMFGPGSVDTFSTNLNLYTRILDRLHSSFHAIERKKVDLGAQRLFNQILILMTSTFPLRMASWLHSIIVKGDVTVHYWPGVDERCQLFGGDQVTDMFGWSGVNGANTDVSVTISTYSDFMRSAVTTYVGELSSGITAAQTMANEIEEEYAHQAMTVGIREYSYFMT